MDTLRISYIAGAFLLLLPVLSHAQTVPVTDTLPAAVKEAARSGMKTLSERVVKVSDISVMATPTGEADFIKFVQTLPGVAGGSDGSSSFYVRGGNMGGNVQTLDGVPIYGTSHLIGLTSVYPAEMMSSAEFQTGGFTSEEGNIGSSHLKLRSKDGSFDTFSAKADLSNFLLGGSVSAPLVKNRLSLNASLRISPAALEYKAVSGMLDPDVVTFTDASAAIYDAYAKLKYRIDARKSLSFTAFHSLDNYHFTLDASSGQSMSWNNLLAILRYDSLWGKRGTSNITASFNHYGNSQGMSTQLGSTSNDLMIRSILNEGTLDWIVTTHSGNNLNFQYGLKTRLAHFNPGSSSILETNGVFPKTSSPLKDNLTNNITGTAHGQLEWGALDRSMLHLAGRMNWNSTGGLAPEASALVRIRIFKFLGVEVTGDYLSQFYHTLEGIPLGWSLDMIVPPSSRLKPEKTKQAYGGLYSVAGNHRFSVGAYYKEMENLVYFSDASKLFTSAIAGWEDNIEVGSGTSKGVETMYEKTGDVLSWRVAYTWSKTDRLFPNLNDGLAFPAKYDRTHVLNATASAKILNKDKMALSLTSAFTYQTGHMETVVAGSWFDDNFLTGPVEHGFYTSFNNYRMPPYIRLDVGAMLEFTGGKHPRTLNLGVYNLLNRHNPFSLSYDAETGTWKQLSLLPIMPSLKYSISF